jgi:hypothetical protein
MKLREVLKSDVTSPLLRWRYGPLVLIAIWAALHVLLGYELVTGQMRLRWRFEWIEGRESSPVLYWIYIAGSAGVLLLVDAYFLRSTFGGVRRKGPIQQQEPMRAKGPHGSS